ncbi:hypothetical protein QCA50_011277 [Cerrena zonata]|uniref:F-box domain-containing protein n=1 Tax=Cerrena zonata TaxID=2478898 RepID=A0AAW0G251_9APHY
MTITFADLPSELLIAILSEACTDSGYTGCSLSLVSKDFRTLCLYSGVDIQCVALYGFQRMANFADMLKTRDKGARKVMHLFITDRDSVDNLLSSLTLNENDDSFARRTLENILRTISPHHLRTLTIHIPHCILSTPAGHPIFSYPFPSLTELSLYAGLNRQFFDNFLPSPSLKRLNIASYITLPEDIGASVCRIAPNLTHLRISLRTHRAYFSNIREVIKNYIEDVSPPTPLLSKPPIDFLASPAGDNPLPLSMGELPPSVHTFIVAFNPLCKAAVGSLASRNMNMQHHTDVAWVKRAIPSHPAWYGPGKCLLVQDQPSVIDLDEPEGVSLSTSGTMYSEWKERIQGNAGCWKHISTA